jgi:hypothetical protein
MYQHQSRIPYIIHLKKDTDNIQTTKGSKKESGRPPHQIVTTPVFPEIIHPNSLPHK